MPFWDRFFGQKKSEQEAPPDILKTINAFIATKTWSESQRFLEQHPELLNPQVDSMMQALVMAPEDEGMRRKVEAHRALLARCREVGAEEAFAEKMRSVQATAGSVPTEFELLAIEIDGLPGFGTDLVEAQRLEAQMLRDPTTTGASGPLIRLCERMLRRLQSGEHFTLVSI